MRSLAPTDHVHAARSTFLDYLQVLTTLGLLESDSCLLAVASRMYRRSRITLMSTRCALVMDFYGYFVCAWVSERERMNACSVQIQGKRIKYRHMSAVPLQRPPIIVAPYCSSFLKDKSIKLFYNMFGQWTHSMLYEMVYHELFLVESTHFLFIYNQHMRNEVVINQPTYYTDKQKEQEEDEQLISQTKHVLSDSFFMQNFLYIPLGGEVFVSFKNN